MIYSVDHTQRQCRLHSVGWVQLENRLKIRIINDQAVFARIYTRVLSGTGQLSLPLFTI